MTDRPDETAPPIGRYAPGRGARALLMLTRHTVLGRGKARKALGRAFERLHPGPVDTDLWGAAVRLHPRGNVSERKALLNPARFNRTELMAVARRIARPGAVFVDIGANAGLFSLYAARHAAPGATIVAIEPNPELFARLSFNLRAETIARGPDEIEIRLVRTALGDHDGTAILEADPDELGSGHIVETGEHGIAVPLHRLTEVLAALAVTAISVMKIDVEGYEDRVLEPFFADAPRGLWPAMLIIEHLSRGDWRYDCIGECGTRGYAITGQSKSNSILELPARTGAVRAENDLRLAD